MAKVNKNTSKTQQKKKTQKAVSSLSIIHPDAAGIDIGQTIHAVAVPPGSVSEGEEPVRIFGTMSCDLKEIAAWLKACGVDTVAMESTGVYWKPLFSLLTREGFEVYLVNARNVKNVSGRKTDESDAAWLQKLHACGLLALRNEGVVETGPTDTVERQNKKTKYKNHPRFNARGYLHRILGVDVLAIYGLSDGGGLQILGETGTDTGQMAYGEALCIVVEPVSEQ